MKPRIVTVGANNTCSYCKEMIKETTAVRVAGQELHYWCVEELTKELANAAAQAGAENGLAGTMLRQIDETLRSESAGLRVSACRSAAEEVEEALREIGRLSSKLTTIPWPVADSFSGFRTDGYRLAVGPSGLGFIPTYRKVARYDWRYDTKALVIVLAEYHKWVGLVSKGKREAITELGEVCRRNKDLILSEEKDARPSGLLHLLREEAQAIVDDVYAERRYLTKPKLAGDLYALALWLAPPGREGRAKIIINLAEVLDEGELKDTRMFRIAEANGPTDASGSVALDPCVNVNELPTIKTLHSVLGAIRKAVKEQVKQHDYRLANGPVREIRESVAEFTLMNMMSGKGKK